jgi:putative ATPase
MSYLDSQSGQNKEVSDEVLLYIAKSTSGDVRHAIGVLENAYFSAEGEITREVVDEFNVGIGNFDTDTHFDLLSCLQKSIRGSDPDATMFYLAKLLSAGELISVCRRLQVIASEDIGLAYPLAVTVTRAACESAKELGMPEARIPLANAAILLATAPKSNSAESAIDAAMADVEAGMGRVVPKHLQSPLFKGYKYPHMYPNHYVEQQYLPDDLVGKHYYEYGDNKTEAAAREYAERIRKK